MSHLGEGPPRQVFIWGPPGKGNYYQNKPDGQPLRMFSHHIPHHRAWTNTTTRSPSRHSSPSPAPMHAPLMHLHFLSTTVRQEAWPKGQQWTDRETGDGGNGSRGEAWSHSTDQKKNRMCLLCLCWKQGCSQIGELLFWIFYTRVSQAQRSAHVPIAGSWGSSLNTAGWHKDEGAARPS